MSFKKPFEDVDQVNKVGQQQNTQTQQNQQAAQGAQTAATGATNGAKTNANAAATSVFTGGYNVGNTGKTASGGNATYTVNAGNEPYVQQLNALYDQVMNRKPFQYDLNSDLLYKQMADSYMQAGQKAMRDTMGTAAGLTGGYGNSYAQQVGNQAYQEHLTALNDKIPSLYEQALNAYLNEGDQMLQQYQLAAAHPGYVNAIKPQTYTVTQNSNDTLTDMQKVQNSIVSGSVAGGTVAPVNDETWYYKLFGQKTR